MIEVGMNVNQIAFFEGQDNWKPYFPTDLLVNIEYF